MIRSRRPTIAAVLALAALVPACQLATEESPSEASATPSTAASPTAAEPSASATSSPSTEPSAPEGEETSVFDLEPGDCFSAGESERIDTVFVVDCASPHVYEAFHVFDHEAGADEAYPGDEEVLEYADTECQVPFQEFVGIAYEDSLWYITSVTPSAETWAEGDREIVCTVALETPAEVTGSARGSAE